jgi:hypothetical protein
MRCWTAPARSMKGELTQFMSASSSRGRSIRPKTQSDLEVTGTSHPRIATTTTAATTDVAVGTMIVVTTGDVITSSQKTTATSATCLPYRRQATPTAHSNKPRGRST